MSEAHSDVLNYLVAVVGLLLLIIVGVILLSTRKQKQKPAVAQIPRQDDASLAPQSQKIEAIAAIEADEFAPSKSLKLALEKTEKSLFGRLSAAFSSGQQIDDNFEILEETLYTADIGPATVERLMESVRESLSKSEKKDLLAVKTALKSEISQILRQEASTVVETALAIESNQNPLAFLKFDHKPLVLMIVGVNGAGKTTSIGKMSAHFAKNGKKVLVAAGDTFRAAAESQLKVWTDRAQVEIFSPPGVKDPSAVAFDALSKAISQNFDVVLIDTAGRLHTQAPLMEELKKVKRVLAKADSLAPHETLIVLDANSGQNALMQAKEFHQAIGLTGVILTKMDGTAKGGVVIGLSHELKIPIRMIGIGEKIGDLKAFSQTEFINSIFQEV